MSIKSEYIDGSNTYTSWKIGIAGLVGPQGATGPAGPEGGFGVVNDGYYMRSANGAPLSGSIYHTSQDLIGINTLSPLTTLDVSGTFRVRDLPQSDHTTSGHLVVNPVSGIVHVEVPKIEYQKLDGDGTITSWTLTSACRGSEWLMIWDMTNKTFIPPSDYTVTNAILNLDPNMSSFPPGDLEVRHIKLY
jgi:hypothetical protein